MEIEEPSISCQAPICPFCFDDHSSEHGCDEQDLKKEILLRKFDDFERTCRDEKQDGSLPNTIKEMIKWL